MAKRVYMESVKSWLRDNRKTAAGGGAVAGTLAISIFIYLQAIGAITVLGHSDDMVCAGTQDDPCLAYINFTANEDIFLYPVGYDPWGRDTLMEFDPAVKDWEMYRSWGSGWRKIDLSTTCRGTWCGGKYGTTDNKYSFAFRKGRTYQILIRAFKHNPEDTIKWGAFDGEIDPVWKGIGADTRRRQPTKTEYTYTTKKTCYGDGTCNIILHSRTAYGYEDNRWKPIDSLRSFKGTTDIRCIVNRDGALNAQCLDYNATAMRVRLAPLKSEIQKRPQMTVRIVDKNDERIEKQRITKDFSKIEEGTIEGWFNVSIGEVLHFGENSTTIELTGGNLTNYTSVDDASDVYAAAIKFYAPEVAGKIISAATLNIDCFRDDTDGDMKTYAINNQTWSDGDGASAIYGLKAQSTNSTTYSGGLDSNPSVNVLEQTQEMATNLLYENLSYWMEDPDNVPSSGSGTSSTWIIGDVGGFADAQGTFSNFVLNITYTTLQLSIDEVTCTSPDPDDSTEPYETTDTTPEFSVTTNLNANCSISDTNNSYALMSSTGETTTHAGNISAGDELNLGVDYVYINCSKADNASDWITTELTMHIVEQPKWSDNSTNSTTAGADIEFRVKWTDTDGLSNLSNYTFFLYNGSNTTVAGNPITQELYSDDMQDSGDWVESGDCSSYWTYGSSTPSGNTGPQSGDSSTDANSNFVFMETSNGNCDGSPSSGYLTFDQDIDWDAQDGENVTFETNRYGTSDLGTMIMQENSSGTWRQLGTYSQTGDDGNSGTVWTKFGINASNLTGTGRVRFYSYDHSSYQGDNSIDAFNITYLQGTSVNTEYQKFTGNIGGTLNWTNITKNINDTVGATIKWYMTVEDENGYKNTTDVFQFTTTAAPGSNITKCRPFNVTNSQGALTDQPIYLEINYDSDMQTDFDDIRIYNGTCFDDNNVQMPAELEAKTDSSIAYVWFKGNLSNGANSFSMAYGNASASSDWDDGSKVFDDDFVAVLHMADGTDSSPDQRTLDVDGPTNKGPGAAGNYYDFDGNNDWMNVSNSDGGMTGMATLTFEWWMNKTSESDSNEDTAWGAWFTAGSNAYVGRYDSQNNELDCITYTGGNDIETNSVSVEDGTWHYYVCRYTGAALEGYLDDSLLSTGASASGSISSNTLPIDVGVFTSPTPTDYMNGDLDEMRVSKTSRSADYIGFVYDNINNQSGVISFGAEESSNQTVQTKYYFNASGGSDSNDCSLASPCQTINKHNTLNLNPGDTVYWACGESWRMTTDAWWDATSGSSSGWISETSYGTCTDDNKPLFYGSDNVSDSAAWTDMGNDLWKWNDTFSVAVGTIFALDSSWASDGMQEFENLTVEGRHWYNTSNDELWINASQNPVTKWGNLEATQSNPNDDTIDQEAIFQMNDHDWINISNLHVMFHNTAGFIAHETSHIRWFNNTIENIGQVINPNDNNKVGDCMITALGSTDVYYGYNKAYNCWDSCYGTSSWNTAGAKTIANHTWEYNLCRWGGIAGLGYFHSHSSSTADNITWSHNTVIDTGYGIFCEDGDCNVNSDDDYNEREGGRGLRIGSSPSATTDFNITDNIIYNGSRVSVDFNTSGTTDGDWFIDYNIHYLSAKSFLISDYGSNYNTLAAWVSATDFEDNGIEADPKFSSYTTFVPYSDGAGCGQASDGTDIGAYACMSGSSPQKVIEYNFTTEVSGVAVDTSGNGNNGTTDATWISTGVASGGAYDFDGTSDELYVPGFNFTGMDEFSLVLWFNASSAGYKTIAETQGQFRTRLNGGSVFMCRIYNAGGSVSTDDAPIALHEWQHVACVFNTTHIISYVNGTQYDAKAVADPSTATSTLYFGEQPFGSNRFNGSMDQIQVYNYAINSSTVQTIYNAEAPGGETECTCPGSGDMSITSSCNITTDCTLDGSSDVLMDCTSGAATVLVKAALTGYDDIYVRANGNKCIFKATSGGTAR